MQLKNFKLKDNIGEVITDVTPFIYPLYHTSSKARATRPGQKQREDWQKIPIILEDISKNLVSLSEKNKKAKTLSQSLSSSNRGTYGGDLRGEQGKEGTRRQKKACRFQLTRP